MSDLSDWRRLRPVELRITGWRVDIIVRKRCKWLAVAWTSACLSMLSWVAYGDQYNAANGVWTSNTGAYQSVVSAGGLAKSEANATSFSDSASMQTGGTTSAAGSFTINYVWSGPSAAPAVSYWLVTSIGGLAGIGSATPTLTTGYGNGQAINTPGGPGGPPSFGCPVSMTTLVSKGGASPSFTDAYSALLSGGFGTGGFNYTFSVVPASLSVGPGSGTAGGGTTTGGTTTGGDTTGGTTEGGTTEGSTTSGDPGGPYPPPYPPTTSGNTAGSTAGFGTGGDTAGNTTAGGTTGSTAGGGGGSGGVSVTGSGLTLINGVWEALVGAPVSVTAKSFDTNSSGQPIGTWTITGDAGNGVCGGYTLGVGPVLLTTAQLTNVSQVIFADYLPETVTATFNGTYQGMPVSYPFKMKFEASPGLKDNGLINDPNVDRTGFPVLEQGKTFICWPASTYTGGFVPDTFGDAQNGDVCGTATVWSWGDPFPSTPPGQTQLPAQNGLALKLPADGLPLPTLSFDFVQIVNKTSGSATSNPLPPYAPRNWTLGLDYTAADGTQVQQAVPAGSLDSSVPYGNIQKFQNNAFIDFPGSPGPPTTDRISSFTFSDDFSTYLYYTLQGGIPIPMEVNNWTWSNTFTSSGPTDVGSWSPTTTDSQPQPCSKLPTWGYTLLGPAVRWY